jgi:hypothetical protein
MMEGKDLLNLQLLLYLVLTQCPIFKALLLALKALAQGFLTPHKPPDKAHYSIS